MAWSQNPEKIPYYGVGKDTMYPHRFFLLVEDENGHMRDNEPAWTISGLSHEAEELLQMMRDRGRAESTIASQAIVLERFINYLARGDYKVDSQDEPKWIGRR